MWRSGILGTNKEPAEPAEDARQAKRDKLEADRNRRAEQRAQSKKKLQAALQSRKEANDALKAILDIAPDIFEGEEACTDEVAQEILEETDTMPDDDAVQIDFEDENAKDGDKALDYTRTLKLEYNASEVEFWFTQLENEMYTCEVKSQWLKRCVLVKNLPAKIQNDVKALLILPKSAAPTDLYKRIKTEILRIHAPKKEDTFKKALSRVLVGLPSQLGQDLINDM